jgi:hypothetical protein
MKNTEEDQIIISITEISKKEKRQYRITKLRKQIKVILICIPFLVIFLIIFHSSFNYLVEKVAEYKSYEIESLQNKDNRIKIKLK